MAAMSAKRPMCRRALEFAMATSFEELVIEGDNAMVMKSIASVWIEFHSGGHFFSSWAREFLYLEILGMKYDM